MNPRYLVALIAFVLVVGMAISPAIADKAVLVPPTLNSGWTCQIADSASAASADVSPVSVVVNDLLFPTGNIDSWFFGLSYPDQTKENIEGYALRVDIGKIDPQAPWSTYLAQRDLNVKDGESFVFRLRAKANAPRHVLAVLQSAGGDYHDVGLSRSFDLTGDWQTFDVPFTVHDAGNIGQQFVIQMGQQTGTVWLADASIAPLTGSVRLAAPLSAVAINVTKPGLHPWSVQYFSKEFDLENGHHYILTYAIMADTVHKITANAHVNSGDWHDVGLSYSGEVVGTSWRYVRLPFTATNVKANNTLVDFCLGASQTGTVSIGDVKLIEAGT